MRELQNEKLAQLDEHAQFRLKRSKRCAVHRPTALSTAILKDFLSYYVLSTFWDIWIFDPQHNTPSYRYHSSFKELKYYKKINKKGRSGAVKPNAFFERAHCAIVLSLFHESKMLGLTSYPTGFGEPYRAELFNERSRVNKRKEKWNRLSLYCLTG